MRILCSLSASDACVEGRVGSKMAVLGSSSRGRGTSQAAAAGTAAAAEAEGEWQAVSILVTRYT